MTTVKFSINNPHPEHRPNVFRISTGTRPQGGRCYASGMRCSCGWTPYVDRIYGVDAEGNQTVRERPKTQFYNEAPSSRGSKAEAKSLYLKHLTELGLIEEGSK